MASESATSPQDQAVRRIAFIAPDATSLLRQRSSLIAELLARRHYVLALVPEHAGDAIGLLNERGMAAATYPMPAGEPQVLADRTTVKSLSLTLAEWRTHVVLSHGPKPMLLGAMAAQKAGVARRVALVTALPDAMQVDAAARPTWGWSRLLRGGFKALDAVILHNEAHRLRLASLGLLRGDLPAHVVTGAGVDLAHHEAQPLATIPADTPAALNFVMIARRDAAKGTIEFCAAAKRVRARAPDTRFVLAGAPGDVDAARFAAYGDSVEVLDDQDDVRPLLAAAHVVVVPSWGESMPRVLLEALATGRPVIASDIPGCREAIDERVNGVLVPPRNATALADAMLSFVARPDLNGAMARASRSKAERRFDVRTVNATILRVLGV